MEIRRSVETLLKQSLKPGKVNVLVGTRRVGKTHLIQKIGREVPYSLLVLEGEDVQVQLLLAERSIANYQRILAGIELLVIDEAQAIPEIGKILKLIVDHIPGIRVLVTGSSAFDLTQRSGEPLTGRSFYHYLYPIAQQELNAYETPLQVLQYQEERLLFGGYPELFQLETPREKERYLRELVQAYLLKDILAYEGIRNTDKVKDLLRLIAFQAGKEVSMDELGKQLQLSKNTVEKYLDLLTKVFVLRKVGGFSRNLRKEVTKTSRWYFQDTGVRNAVVNDFRPLALRTDVGELWETYLISERIKYLHYAQRQPEYFFWRTYDQQEIDWLEYENGRLSAFEFKWKTQRARVPKAFANAYPEATFELITSANYLSFIGG
ncbi:ATP-binding protein [Telluribacter sp.]|uniref:ATP-binding protein n=1 Tax=Telluribacter sp. TaxID=1978767 RepID=UPI002E0F1E37|nr:ATP-binding protein [Telluribacter sp.]